jgi:hypothetical protein
MFGYTLMLAGLMRIIEICFITTSSSMGSLDDDESEHTLTSGINARGESRSKAKAGRAFRHLPPFVRAPSIVFDSCFFSDDWMAYGGD